MNKSIFVAAAALTALVLAPALALANAGDLKLPAYKEFTLKNGARVFIMETREVPLVTVRLLLPAGSAMDEPGSEGVANLAGRLLQKAAAGLSEDQISGMIEDVGGRIDVWTGRDYSIVNGDFLAQDLPRALDIMGKITLAPDFPRDAFEREKGLVAAEIKAEREEPMSVASKEFARVLMEGHPYAHPVEGDEASVGALSRDKVLEFYKTHYVPAGSILAIVGDVDAGRALELVKKTFDGWKGAGAVRPVPALAPRPSAARTLYVIDKPDATQSQIRIGNLAVGRGSPEHFQLLVANNILGGGFTSRLMEEIRVNRGLSYGARSDLAELKAGGYFGVTTFTKNKTLRETVDVALDQLKRIRTEKMSDAELTSSKKYLSGLYPFELETNGDLAGALEDISFYSLPLDYVEGYGTHVATVTPDEAMKVAGEHFWTDGDVILLLTNYNEVKDQLRGLGEAKVVSIDQVK